MVVVGSANRDLTVEVERRPEAGETVLGGDTRTSAGGKGANVAVAAAKLGSRVAMVGAVGADSAGEELLGSLRAAGVDTGLVRRCRRPSGAAYITVTPDGENSIIVSPGANGDLGVPDVQAAAGVIAAARVLFTVPEVPMETVAAAVRSARDRQVRVVFNASPVTDLEPDILAAADPLVVNGHEAAWLLGVGPGESGEPGELVRGLRELGARSVVVTLGARGAVTSDDAMGQVTVPAPAVTPVDTTGAGDAFSGALVSRLAEGAQLPEAARFAARVAAISVSSWGAQDSYPAADQLA
ncbi:ribokinase [Haloechinothrix sp. LS1_15]|nr:ribokinase [Haloechinothrix sp. LS1_15]